MASWIKNIESLTKQKSRIVLGIMSGTSADAIDAALCRINGAGSQASLKLLAFHSRKFSRSIRAKILSAKSLKLAEIAELDLELAEEFAMSAKAALQKAGLNGKGPLLIGSHGQTVYHHSGLKRHRSTLQLGDGDLIAERSGAIVVSDFRRHDIACGGEGAPLTPYADQILFRDYPAWQAVLNLGGIANLTILDAKARVRAGFDTGPANAPLDRITFKITRGAQNYDRAGKLAASGKVNNLILKKLMKSDTFIRAHPPKSTGTETYGDMFVEYLLKLNANRANADLLATCSAFIAESIALALRRYPKVSRLIVAGGGSYNKTLLAMLNQALSPLKLITSDQLGVPAYARECMAFALLANDAIFGLKTSLPLVTGASKACTLGKISLA